MEGLFWQVLDTVDGETPASAATSRMVTATETLLCAEDRGERRVTQPALVSAFIVKEDGRAVNRVRSICAKYLHKVAHSGEQRGMKPKNEEGRICKVSVYVAHDL